MTTDYTVDFDRHPHAFGRPASTGRLRSSPEDFEVEEVLGFAPDDDGPHQLLWVEKRGANTEWVAKQFARLAGCRAMDVGFSGMKDRHAVTRQWFSVPAPKQSLDWTAVDVEGVRVLAVHAHRRKLRRGAHRANRFVLTLRAVVDGGDLDERCERIARAGVPNYFGPQRFGPRGDNVARAIDGARGGIYLSAARSFLFNEVLAARLREGSWDRLLPGEAVQLDGSGSFFLAEAIDGTLLERLANFDIHPSGPLWGRGEPPSLGEAAAIERAVVERFPEVAALVERAGMRQERRPLRLTVRDIRLARPEPGVLVIAFELPAGAFATSVLRELIDTPQGDEHARAD